MNEDLFAPRGRIRRSAYWLRWVIVFAISIFVGVIFGRAQQPSLLRELLSFLLSCFIVIQGVKRMHDVGKSGWYLLIPIYGFILLLTDGTPGPNAYGNDPKERRAAY